MIRALTRRVRLSIIDAEEETVVVSYHEAMSYQAEEAEERLQAPRISPAEAEEEVRFALLASVMVGGPV